MRIERVEEICLNCLRDAESPLVPVTELYQQCVDTENVGHVLTEEALLQFLRGHADVVVVEGIGEDDSVEAAVFDKIGIVSGAHAMLESRVPTRDEMKEMLEIQLAHMRENLKAALQQAQQNKDKAKADKIEALIENTDAINERLQEF